MASTQNYYYDHYIPYFPQPPPHNNHPIPPKVTPPHTSPPSPPNVAPPHGSPPAIPPPGHPLMPPPKVPPPPPFPVPATPPAHSFHPPPPAHSRPPPAPTAKPPPHPFLPPPPLPPSPPSGHHSSTVIVVVFVSLGGLFFLAFLSVALFCFLKKKKKVKKSELVHVDEHVKVEEAIISGPHGEEVKVLSIEEEVHIQEEVDKKSVVEGLNSRASTTSGSNHQHHKA